MQLPWQFPICVAALCLGGAGGGGGGLLIACMAQIPAVLLQSV